ncbi:unnamed protein product [Schistosoma curassoni]|uniref:BRCT domain-containing protein n=1 Tax=Schistosoma curassoni TaxID=6186 RepID=A0A183KYB4_9TREM|nr:unnamed protein product [Schistosoma curassoni]
MKQLYDTTKKRAGKHSKPERPVKDKESRPITQIQFLVHEKAFDSVDRKTVCKLLQQYDEHEKIVNIIRNSYDGLHSKVVHVRHLTDTF